MLILSCEYSSAYVMVHLEFSSQTWLLFPTGWVSSYLPNTSGLLSAHWWRALSFYSLHQQKNPDSLHYFGIKEEDVVFFFHRTPLCLNQRKTYCSQYLWFSVTRKLSVVCVSVSWILMSHVNPTFVTNFTVIDHLHRVWIITSPNRIPNIMTTLTAPSNWFTCVTMAASCCIVLQRLSD